MVVETGSSSVFWSADGRLMLPETKGTSGFTSLATSAMVLSQCAAPVVPPKWDLI